MSNIKKINVSGVTYDISPSPNGILDQFISPDISNPSLYTQVNKINPSVDTIGTIFTKMTDLIKNTRYIFNELGRANISTGDDYSLTINQLLVDPNSQDTHVDTHSHSVDELPITNVLVNSSSYIPSLPLVYEIEEDILQAGSSPVFEIGEDLVAEVSVGGINQGDSINETDLLAYLVRTILNTSSS